MLLLNQANRRVMLHHDCAGRLPQESFDESPGRRVDLADRSGFTNQRGQRGPLARFDADGLRGASVGLGLSLGIRIPRVGVTFSPLGRLFGPSFCRASLGQSQATGSLSQLPVRFTLLLCQYVSHAT